LDRFTALDEQRRQVVRRRDDLNGERNRQSQEIGALMKSGQKDLAESRRAAVREIGDQITVAEAELASVESELNTLLTTIPNLPDNSVPVGRDESANQEIKQWGMPRSFDFAPKDHVDLATDLGLLDLERATKLSGTRFSILTGVGARL